MAGKPVREVAGQSGGFSSGGSVMELGRRDAPAKLNLALDILGPRPDGYHEMRMVMHTVSLCDRLSLREEGEGFTLPAEGDFCPPPGKKTLEQQAAEAFFRAVGRPMPGLAAFLEKRIPAYAGLGGGSADVAALLRLLREAYAPELPLSELERIGGLIGSDMPFCIRGGACLAEGRGDRLTDLPPLPPCWIVICKPDFGVPTSELFARVDGIAFRNRPDTGGMIRALEAGDLAGVTVRLCNVFEEVLPPSCGEVFQIKDRLLTLGAMNAAMSGSGPAVFGVFQNRDMAAKAAEALGERYAQTFLTKPAGKL